MDPALLAGLAICLLSSVFFSITDSALAHFSWARLEMLARSEARRERLRRHLEQRHTYQLACFALNSVGNILFVILLTDALRREYEQTTGQVLLALGYSLLFVLLLGEVIPRAWGQGNADRWLSRVFPVVHVVTILVTPLTVVLRLCNTVVGRLAGVPMQRSENVEYGDEIRSVVTDGEKEGVLEEQEREMIASIFELHDIEVAEVMTPRTDMVCIEADAALEELRTLASKCGYSRIPVFKKTRDNIVGIVHVKDLLSNGEVKATAGQVAQPPYLVPETKKVHELLHEFRAHKIHMAIVLDEYGGTAGLITLEDIVEEIVGEIEDEFDEAPPEPLRQIDLNTIECDGRLPIDDLNDALRIELPEDESYDTIGGFVIAELGHIPAEEEICRWQNVEFTVLAATERRINQLRVTVQPDEEPNGRE